MDDAIRFDAVTKAFGGLHALDGLDLRVRPAEMYGLLGPNGAGKTTAIRILIGLQRATRGRVSVLGRDPQDPALRPLVGYMPQETALYQDLTVRENLALFGRLHGMGGSTLRARIDEVLRLVDLPERRDALVSRLSGGMKHRTSLATTLLPRPRLLVLDEPTVGVDPELRAGFWDHFASLREEGVTILLTTHYMDEARRCSRVGFLRRGRLLVEGEPSALMERARVDNLEDAFLHLARHEGAGA